MVIFNVKSFISHNTKKYNIFSYIADTRIYKILEKRIVFAMREKVIGPDYKSLKENYVSVNVIDNENFIKEILSKSDDLRFKKLNYGSENREILLVYIESVIDDKIVQDYVIAPLISNMNINTNTDTNTNANNTSNNKDTNKSKDVNTNTDINNKDLSINTGDISISELKNRVLQVLTINEVNTFDVLILNLLSGSTLLFLQGSSTALIIKSKSERERSLETPETEQTIRGSRVGLTENINTNITLIRRQIRDPNLCVEIVKLGERSQKDIGVIYISGVVDKEIPKGIIQRINEIDRDGVIGSGQLEQILQKPNWLILPQMLATERLDTVVGNLLEGRVVVIVDGTPIVLINPVTFNMLISSPDDYFQTPLISTLLRLIRYMSYVICTSLEGLYLSLVSYQTGMIPTPLALSITGSRIGLPFPVILEVILMELTLYVIQEAAIRLPNAMGTTVGIVGGLVIGQSVVQAGIVSPIIVIIVAGSAITSFALPNYNFTLGCILIRIFLLIMSSILGLYGLVMGWIILIIHLASLENFGVRFLSDFSPYTIGALKDGMIKVNEKMIYKRPPNLKSEDDIRGNSNIKVDDSYDKW